MRQGSNKTLTAPATPRGIDEVGQALNHLGQGLRVHRTRRGLVERRQEFVYRRQTVACEFR